MTATSSSVPASPAGLEQVQEEPATGGPRRHLVAALTLVGLVNAWYAWPGRLPTWANDEGMPLLIASRLAGVAHSPPLIGLPYDIGWALLLVPSWWLGGDDPHLVYRFALATTALSGTALVLPLRRLAQLLGCRPVVAVWTGAALALLPARAVYASFVLSETLVTLLTAWVAVYLVRFARSHRAGDGIVLALLAVATFLAHARSVALIGVLAVWFLWLWRTRPGARISLIVLVVTAVTGRLVATGLVSQMYSTIRVGDISSSREAALLESSRALWQPSTALIALGQPWYHAAASLGIFSVGTVVLLAAALAEARRREVGAALVWTGVVAGSSALTLVLLGSGVDLLPPRYDVFMYGRYLEPVLLPVLAVGLVAVLARHRRAVLAGIAVSVVLLLVRVTLIEAALDGRTLGFVINVAGLQAYPLPPEGPVSGWAPAVLMLAFPTVALLVTRWRHGTGLTLALLACASLALGAVGVAKSVHPLAQQWNSACTLRGSVDALKVSRLYLDVAHADDDAVESPGLVYDMFAWYCMAPVPMVWFDSRTDPLPDGFILQAPQFAAAEAAGGRIVALDHVYAYALWLTPGEQLDRLAATGDLIAQPLDRAPTDAEAAALSVQVDGDLHTALSEPGRGQLTLSSRDGGRTWPEFTQVRPVGTLRLVLWWDVDGTNVATIADLPRALGPDDRVQVSLDLDPPAGVRPGAQMLLVQPVIEGGVPVGPTHPVPIVVDD